MMSVATPLDNNAAYVVTEPSANTWAAYYGYADGNQPYCDFAPPGGVTQITVPLSLVVNVSRIGSSPLVWQYAYHILQNDAIRYVILAVNSNTLFFMGCTNLAWQSGSVYTHFEIYTKCEASFPPTPAPTYYTGPYGPLTEEECDAVGGVGTWEEYAFEDNNQTYVRYCNTPACYYTFENGNPGVLANACPPQPTEAHVRNNTEVCEYCRDNAGIEMMYCADKDECNSTHTCPFSSGVYYDACVGEGDLMYPDYGPMNVTECVERGGTEEYWAATPLASGIVPTRYCDIALCDETYTNEHGDVTNACPATPSEGRIRDNVVPCEYCVVDDVITMMYCNNTCFGEYKCPTSHLWNDACVLEYPDAVVDYGPMSEAECHADGGTLWAEYNFTDTGVRYARFCNVAACWQSFKTSECDTIRSHLPTDATISSVQGLYKHCAVTGAQPSDQNYTATEDTDITACAVSCVADVSCTGFVWLLDVCYLNIGVSSLPLVVANSSYTSGVYTPYVDDWWTGCDAHDVSNGSPSEVQNIPGYCTGSFLFYTSWNETDPDFAMAYSELYYYDVSITSEGTTLAVGTPSSTGVVRVFTYNNGWTQQDIDIVGGTDDYFGFSVALAAEDTTLMAVGAIQTAASPGYVRYFKYASETWGALGSDLTGTAPDDMFGYDVDLSANGSVLVVGAPNSLNPYVTFFDCDGLGCTQSGKLVGTGSYGYSVSVSSDGTVVAIGNPDDVGYDFEANVWSGGDVFIIGGQTENWGLSVAINPNGTLIAYTNNNGTVLIYEIGVGIHSFIATMDASCTQASVAWSHDGQILVVGNFVFGGAGLYVYRTNAWVGAVFFTSEPNAGASVSASYDGKEIAISSLMTRNYTVVWINYFANKIDEFAGTQAECVLECTLNIECTHFYFESPVCTLFSGITTVNDSLAVVSGIKNTQNTLNACPFLSTESHIRNNSQPCSYCMGNATDAPIEMAYCPGVDACRGMQYCSHSLNLYSDACVADYYTAPIFSPTAAPTSAPTPYISMKPCFVTDGQTCSTEQSSTSGVGVDTNWCLYDDFYTVAQYVIHPYALGQSITSLVDIETLDLDNQTLLKETMASWLDNGTSLITDGACWCPTRATEWFPYGPVTSMTVTGFGPVPTRSYPRAFYATSSIGTPLTYYTDLNTRADAVVVVENNTNVYVRESSPLACPSACEYVTTSIDNKVSCAFVCAAVFYVGMATPEAPLTITKMEATNATQCSSMWFIWANQYHLLRMAHAARWQEVASSYTNQSALTYVWTPWLNMTQDGNCPLLAEYYCSIVMVPYETYADFYNAHSDQYYRDVNYAGIGDWYNSVESPEIDTTRLRRLIPLFNTTDDLTSAKSAIYSAFWMVFANISFAEIINEYSNVAQDSCTGTKNITIPVNASLSVNITVNLAWMGQFNSSGCMGLYGCSQLDVSVCNDYPGCVYVYTHTETTTTTTMTVPIETLPPYQREYPDRSSIHLYSPSQRLFVIIGVSAVGLALITQGMWRHHKPYQRTHTS